MRLRITIIVTILLCLLIVMCAAILSNITTISGVSMEPTLSDGDKVYVVKPVNLCRNDVVILNAGDQRIIKRIVAIPGDTVQIRNGHVYVNGDIVDELYTEFGGTAYEPLILGEDEYFALGDNRAQSKDSRYRDIGVVYKSQIVYKAWILKSVIQPTIGR